MADVKTGMTYADGCIVCEDCAHVRFENGQICQDIAQVSFDQACNDCDRIISEVHAVNDAARPAIKTYSGWGESRQNLGEYLQIGDIVDSAMVDYFVNVLPPITKNGLIQMGEPCSHTAEGRGTYATLKKTGHGWQYCGHCCAGETEHHKGYIEMMLEREAGINVR